jgi:hypothetical protein
MVGPLVPNGSDQSGSSLSSQREQGQEIRLVQISMQFSVEWRAFPLDVCNIEEMSISATWEARANGLANKRAGAVAARDVSRLADLLTPIRTPEAGCDETTPIFEPDQLGAAFNGDAKRPQPLDEETLVFVLRKDEQEGIRSQVRPYFLER